MEAIEQQAAGVSKEDKSQSEHDQTGATAPDDFMAESERLAASGSEGHVIFVARNKIKQARAGTNPTENGAQAVQWLLPIANMGNKEASDMLRECVRDKIGVTEANIGDITKCLETPDVTKAVRRAAHALYVQLHPPVDEPFTQELFQKRVDEFAKNKQEKKFLKSTARKLQNPDEITEVDFVETVTRRMGSGQIDPMQDEVELAAYNQSGIIRKLTKYPGPTITMTVDAAIDFLTGDGLKLGLSAIPVDQINVLIAFFLLSIISLSWLGTVLVTIIFYLSLTVMIVATVQMFRTRRKVNEISNMAEMLGKFSENVDKKSVREAYICNSMAPYWTFFGALFCFVPTFYLSNRDWVPCAEITVVSASLSITCFIFLTHSMDGVAFLSFLLNFLSTTPHLVGSFTRFPALNKFLRLITKPFFSAQLLPHFYFNISVPSICYLSMFIMLGVLILGKSRSRLYGIVIPHLVSFFWWQVAAVCFEVSTWVSLARASFGWIGATIMAPLLAIVGVVYGIYYAVVFMNWMTVAKVGVTLLIVLIPVLLTVWQGYGFSLGYDLSGKSLKFKLLALFVLALLASPVAFLAGGEDEEVDTTDMYLSWDLYKTHCTIPAWREGNIATSQLFCNRFVGMDIEWIGKLKSINVAGVENAADDFLKQLPGNIAEWLKCLYGEPYGDCDKENMSPEDFVVCELRVKYGHLCHMDARSTYTFVVEVDMQVEDDNILTIIFNAGHNFKETLLKLQRDNLVKVKGQLYKNLGSAKPEVHLEKIECQNCMMQLMAAREEEDAPEMVMVKKALQTCSFFTEPVLEYDERRKLRKRNKAVNDDIPTPVE